MMTTSRSRASRHTIEKAKYHDRKRKQKVCFNCHEPATEVTVYAERKDYIVYEAVHKHGSKNEVHYWSVLRK